MTHRISDAAAARAAELRRRLKRYKLVFVQCGAVFDVLRDPLVAEVGGSVVRAIDFAVSPPPIGEIDNPLTLIGLEDFAKDGSAGGVTLGALRQKVDAYLESGAEVCMLSRAPRTAYYPVPGSSLVEDSSIFCLPLLGVNECETEMRESPTFMFPSLGLQGGLDIRDVFCRSLEELGVNVLAALDHAVFEAKLGSNFLDLLEPRELEALRGAGLAFVVEEEVRFAAPIHFRQFEDSIAHVLASIVSPQPDLASVSEGLWFIERTIRKSLRDAAVSKFSERWRKNVLHGDLPPKVLARARLDVNVTASSVGELRDPIEWLSLGELLQVVQSNKFDGLALDNLSWKRFAQDVVPIRNRLSHMRLIKKGDKETVTMWASRIKKAFS